MCYRGFWSHRRKKKLKRTFSSVCAIQRQPNECENNITIMTMRMPIKFTLFACTGSFPCFRITFLKNLFSLVCLEEAFVCFLVSNKLFGCLEEAEAFVCFLGLFVCLPCVHEPLSHPVQAKAKFIGYLKQKSVLFWESWFWTRVLNLISIVTCSRMEVSG